MSTSALRSTRGRRLVVVAAATMVVGTLGTVAPSSAVIAASAATVATASTRTAGMVTASGVAPKSDTPRTAPVSRTVPASRATVRTAAVAPYRYGTRAYNKWWARTYMAKRYHWTSARQYICLVHLWNRESGWSHRAHNRYSGAHGIPQALPGSKMASAGKNWRSNPRTQIKWGLRYIKGRYGTPCGGWNAFQHKGWY